MTVIDVACAVEGPGYAAHSAAMLHSLLARHPDDDVRIHYLPGPGITARDQRRLADMVTGLGASIAFLRVPDERVRGLPTEGFTRTATWYRVFLPELLPEVGRVLYLDADLIVVDSVTPLFDLDFGDRLVGAVTNLLEPVYANRPAELGLDPRHAYFNAGVLLMNLEGMRCEDTMDALLDHAVAHAPELLWRDQDALNVALAGRRLELHPRWNCMNSVMSFPQAVEVFGAERAREARGDPAIRHFEGPGENKPWHYLCPHEDRDLYREHRRHTPWSHVRLEGRTPRNVLRRLGIGRRSVARHSLEDR